VRAAVLFALALSSLTACADLIVRDQDTREEEARKVASRVALCPLTLCYSELMIFQLKEQEKQQAALEEQRRTMMESWNGAIGRLTYEDIVAQLGPPTQLAVGEATLIAIWLDAPSAVVSLPVPSLTGTPAPSTVYLNTFVPGARRELLFDKHTRKLKQWKFE
jgi:hypothetical protein